MTPATDGLQLANRLTPLGKPIVVTVAEPPTPQKWWLTATTAIVALTVVGIAIRILPMLSGRCLWIDEAMLALNLVERTPRQLLEPLDWNQGAPAGFLLLVKSALMMFGTAEWSFRLVPFVASVLGAIGFSWIAQRLLPRPAALMAVALFALSPFLISYSAECKQYAIDAALTVGLFASSVGLLNGKTGLRRWAFLAGAGAGAVWFSHPAAFVLGGIGAALLLGAIVANDRRRALACAVTIASWLTSFGLCYLLCLRQLGNNQYLLDYWAGHFLPLLPASPGDLLWLPDHFFSFIAYPGGLGGTEVKAAGIAAALSVAGVIAMWRDRWPVAVAVVFPALLALAASGLGKYPFAGRLLLFLVPLMLLTVARGAWSVASVLWRHNRTAAVVVIGLLFLAPVIETYQTLRRPPRYEQITPVLATVRESWQPGDKVYIYYGAVPAFTFYTREQPFPPGVVLGDCHREGHTGYRDELTRLAGESRVWLVFSHRHQDEEMLLLSYAEGLGRCTREVHQPGASAYLFDFTGTN